MTSNKPEKPRKPEKPDQTALIRAAVKGDLLPWCAQFGFKRGKRPDWKGPPIGPTIIRHRDGHLDEIAIQWRTFYRPYFMIEFWTDQEERMRPPGIDPELEGPCHASIYPRKRTWRDDFRNAFLYKGNPWYGEGMGLDEAIRLAKQRIIDLDLYLRTGKSTDLIVLGPFSRVFRDPSED